MHLGKKKKTFIQKCTKSFTILFVNQVWSKVWIHFNHKYGFTRRECNIQIAFNRINLYHNVNKVPPASRNEMNMHVLSKVFVMHFFWNSIKHNKLYNMDSMYSKVFRQIFLWLNDRNTTIAKLYLKKNAWIWNVLCSFLTQRSIKESVHVRWLSATYSNFFLLAKLS